MSGACQVSPSMMLLLVCLLLCGECLATDWPPDEPLSAELLHRSLWAQQLSLSLLPDYSLLPGPHVDPNVCLLLLQQFANASAQLSQCLGNKAWPVRVCQHCYHEYSQLKGAISRIGSPVQNTTLSCATTLLHSDRLHVVIMLNDFFDDVWTEAKCASCLDKNNTGVLNSTADFMQLFHELNECFNRTMQEPPVLMENGNFSSVCTNCNDSYRSLNDRYTVLQHTNALCIDLEDAMNNTRRLWSKTFNCTLPCTDTVPVIAVTAFILFLPVVFYLSSFLHSEQKKRKLILPKRFNSNANMAHIQDKRQ
ncbi:osteopetrosis-associated transmembrane protein 1 [Gastrophryne carolinensis]